MPNDRGRSRQPSMLWTALAVTLGVGALVAAVAAFVLNAAARRPIGEGELFRSESTAAVTALTGSEVDTDDLRHLRNRLAIEAVELVDLDGRIARSTSASRVGRALDSTLLGGFAMGGRFGAAAAPLGAPIEIDGVTEWEAGDVLYQVVQPLGDGRSVLLSYDISELLARRSAAREVPGRAIELLALAAALALGAGGLVAARARANRTYREFQIESEYLRRESAVLAEHNRELDDARRRAERAYELAEEKNRIRSEFVMMINHELRTPLTGVVTGAELLAAEGIVGEGTWREVLDDMVRDGNRLREMIDQILAVARIENRALSFELRDVRLVDLVDRLRQLDPSYEIRSPNGLVDRVLRTDPSSLVNLIASLAANARSHGASTVTLSVADALPFSAMLDSGNHPCEAVYFLVEDDGPGIDPDFLPRAFEKFEKDSWSSGTGLGLYIAKMVAEALDASISVVTSPAGSTFAVAVPLAARVGVPA